MTLVVFTSLSESVCTSDRFARSADGKAVGLETVTTVLEDVSVAVGSVHVQRICLSQYQPTLAVCAANGAGQHDILFASTAVQKVSAVGAEDKRPNGSHFMICSECGGVDRLIRM